MTTSTPDFIKLIEDFNKDLMSMYKAKGNDYASNDDAFRNFREVANRTGTTPEKTLMTYVTKHLMAIENYVNDAKLEAEPIESRISDVIVYMWLLYGMVREGK